jgi:hypothetical protein
MYKVTIYTHTKDVHVVEGVVAVQDVSGFLYCYKGPYKHKAREAFSMMGIARFTVEEQE